jgi:hypothetical protein
MKIDIIIIESNNNLKKQVEIKNNCPRISNSYFIKTYEC